MDRRVKKARRLVVSRRLARGSGFGAHAATATVGHGAFRTFAVPYIFMPGMLSDPPGIVISPDAKVGSADGITRTTTP